tara:strand:+ start:102 stop:1925 length:1824 start_codon:yes stop_codon:yes gene_type:complete
MGINFGTAAMAFGSGLIKGDEKARKENLLIHGEKLKVKRDAIIAMKTRKYERDLKNYDKNKTKVDSLNALKSSFANNSIDAATYGKAYIMATKGATEVQAVMKALKTKEAIHKHFATIGNSDPIKNDAVWKDFKTESVIDSNYEKSLDDIEEKYAAQIKKAGNDSPLVNAILGKKKQEIANLNIDIEQDKKDLNTIDEANNTINYISKKEKKEKKELDTIQADISGKAKEVETEEAGYTITNEPKVFIETPPEPYQKVIDKHRTGMVFKSVSDKENAINYLTASHWLNADGAGYYKIDDKGKVIKSTASGKALMKTYADTYNHVLNSIKDSDIYAKDESIGNIGAYFNPTIVHNRTQYLIRTRASNMDETEWFDGKKDMKVIAMVPVNILDISNKINFGDGAVEVDSQKVRDRYEEFLRLIAKEDKFQSKLVKQLDNDVDKVIAIQQDLEDDGPYTDTFKTWLKDQDIYLKEEVKVTDDKGKVTETTTVEEDIEVPKGTKKYPVQRMKNGDIGVVINGILFSIKENLENFKNKSKYVDDKELQSVISEATKFGYNTEKMAPRGPQKYLDQKGPRGTKKINPAWQKLQDLEKSLTSVKPKKITKKKLR